MNKTKSEVEDIMLANISNIGSNKPSPKSDSAKQASRNPTIQTIAVSILFCVLVFQMNIVISSQAK